MSEAQRVRNYLEELGWTQKKLASIMKVSPNQVSRWVTGKSEVPGCVSAYLKLLIGIRRLDEMKQAAKKDKGHKT